jgi:hypothetical protein
MGSEVSGSVRGRTYVRIMPGVVELIDRAAGLPPGPALSAVLAGLGWERVPNARLVEVVQARSRQLAREQAELLAGLAEIARAVPVCELPAGEPEAVARAGRMSSGRPMRSPPV